jgi:type II secretory pathway pseudopilin PulG
MQRILDSDHDGFTLLETVVATGVLVTALAGIAQLFVLSVRSARDAGSQGAALVAAQDKVERLRSLAFSYGPAAEPVTDPGLASTAAQSLNQDTAGAVDFVNAGGAVVDATDPAHGAVFTRRWRVTPVDPFVPEALAIEVCVFRWPADGLTPATALACLATVRARQP